MGEPGWSGVCKSFCRNDLDFFRGGRADFLFGNGGGLPKVVKTRGETTRKYVGRVRRNCRLQHDLRRFAGMTTRMRAVEREGLTRWATSIRLR